MLSYLSDLMIDTAQPQVLQRLQLQQAQGPSLVQGAAARGPPQRHQGRKHFAALRPCKQRAVGAFAHLYMDDDHMHQMN